MKKLIFLLMIGFCSAKGFSQTDSAQLMRKLDQLEHVTNQTKVLLKKSEKIEKQKRTLMDKLLRYIFNLKEQNRLNANQLMAGDNRAAIRAQNTNEPVEEITVPDGIDSIRGSFFYRLFHREIFLLKPYKIINDEKIYLDN